jgi:hypothetical protein
MRFPIKIVTKTGSVYTINESGICLKTDKDGRSIDAFKPFCMKPIPKDVLTIGDVHALPDGEPVIGQRLYISGLNTWWVTTPVVSVKFS